MMMADADGDEQRKLLVGSDDFEVFDNAQLVRSCTLITPSKRLAAVSGETLVF